MRSLVATLIVAVVLWTVPTGAAPEWQTARTAGYALHYRRGGEADAAIVGRFLDAAHARMSKEFGRHRPAELLDGIQLDVYLYPRPHEMASTRHSTMTSNLAREGYKAAIHLLAPSAYETDEAADEGNAGGERNTDYVFRQVVHEVSAVYVQRLILGKPQGWRYDAAAPWFLQGYDEYLSCIHSPRGEETTLAYHRDLVRRDPGRVRFGPTIRVRNPYSDGAVLVDFLHRSFGRDAVQDIWLSPEPTFGEALTAALGTTRQDLEKRWRRWLSTL